MKRVIAGVLVLALSVAVLPASGTARAGRVGDAAAVTAGRTAEPERWWGVAGAIVCGLGANYIRHFGPEPGVIAATIGGCALAIMDVATT